MDGRTRHHILVPSQYLLVADIRGFPALIDNSAIRVHNPIRRHRRVGGGVLERKLGCKLAVHGAWEMDTKRTLATRVADAIAVLLVRARPLRH